MSDTKNEMLDQIVRALGGRAAEELILEDISTGASSDIQQATKIARNMVTRYGMSEKLGPIQFGEDSDEVFIGRDWGHEKSYSEETAGVIDEEVKKIVDNAYAEAKNILREHRDKLDRVAEVLVEKEKITGVEFDQIFEGE